MVPELDNNFLLLCRVIYVDVNNSFIHIYDGALLEIVLKYSNKIFRG